MRIKVYDYLTEDAKQIREKVFMQEQGFQNEFDEIDSVAVQIVMYDETETPVATCRIFEDTEKGWKSHETACPVPGKKLL